MTGVLMHHNVEQLPNGRWRETTVTEYPSAPPPAEAVTGIGESYDPAPLDLGERLAVGGLAGAVLLSAVVMVLFAILTLR